MSGSPIILVGVVLVIVGVVAGIAATIIKSRGDAGYAFTPSGPSYAPAPETHAAEPADLSKLDALLGGSTSQTAVAEPEPIDEPEQTVEPEPSIEPGQAFEPEIVDESARDDEPLPGLWAHLIATEEGPIGVQDRIDMVARLEMVGEKWCVDALKSAVDEEQDPQVNAAVRAALARIG